MNNTILSYKKWIVFYQDICRARESLATDVDGGGGDCPDSEKVQTATLMRSLEILARNSMLESSYGWL